jgi:two-component system response regulator RegA
VYFFAAPEIQMSV